MFDNSGDALDIWKTITSIGTKEVYGSYVLYKGFNSIYPYYWLYKLAVVTGVEQELYIKLFYAISFSIVSIIEFPALYENAFGVKVSWKKRVLFAIISFYFWEPSRALSEMMVDLPCMMYFLIMLNCFYAITNSKKKDILHSLVTGLFVGLCLTASGQYSLPTYIVLLFYVFDRFRQKIKLNFQDFANNLSLLICAVAVKFYNTFFLNSFVEDLRDNGAWIPDAKSWLTAGFPRFANCLCTDYGLFSNRIHDIFLNHYNVNEMVLSSGGISMNPSEYILLVLHHIPSFFVSYVNGILIILSPGGGFHSIRMIHFGIFYSFVFVFVLFGIRLYRVNITQFKEYLKLIIVFVAAIIPLLVMNIEQRCCMQIQGLVLSVSLFGVNTVILTNKKDTTTLLKLVGADILFVIACLVHLATIYDVNYFTR